MFITVFGSPVHRRPIFGLVEVEDLHRAYIDRRLWVFRHYYCLVYISKTWNSLNSFIERRFFQGFQGLNGALSSYPSLENKSESFF